MPTNLTATYVAGNTVPSAGYDAMATAVNFTTKGVYNAVEYGATGNGTTDDTVSLHAARDAAGTNGNVVLPAGTYMVSALNLNVAGQSWLLAPGATLLAKAATTGPQVQVNATGVTIRGGTVDGNKANQTAAVHNTLQVFSDHCTLDRVTVQNTNGYGVHAYGAVSGFSCRDCRFFATYADACLVESDGTADVTDIAFVRNLVERYDATLTGGGAGVTVKGNGATYRARRVVVADNRFSVWPVGASEPGYSDSTACVHLFECVGFTVANNTCRGGSLPITVPDCQQGTIANNFVTDYTLYGIELPSSASIGTTNVTVSGNVVYDSNPRSATYPSQRCVSITNLASYVTLQGNSLYHAQPSNIPAIWLDAGSIVHHVAIIGNTIQRAPSTAGSMITVKSQHITIVGNVLACGGNSMNPIWVDSDNGATSDILIANNQIRDYGTGIGIVWGGTAGLDYAIFTGNIFANGGTGTAIAAAGTGTLGAHTLTTGNVGP